MKLLKYLFKTGNLWYESTITKYFRFSYVNSRFGTRRIHLKRICPSIGLLYWLLAQCEYFIISLLYFMNKASRKNHATPWSQDRCELRLSLIRSAVTGLSHTISGVEAVKAFPITKQTCHLSRPKKYRFASIISIQRNCIKTLSGEYLQYDVKMNHRWD